MMGSEAAIRLAQKVKALADRGEGGEKENAAELLQRLLDKHGLTIQDIDEQEKRVYTVYHQMKHEFLAIQIIDMVMGFDTEKKRIKSKRTDIMIECTADEYLEISAMLDFYSERFDEEVRRLQLAFVQKNDLFPDDDPEDFDEDEHRLSPEEKERVLRMSQSLERHHMRSSLPEARR